MFGTTKTKEYWKKIMREILFRGKRKDNGEWIKGLLLKQLDLDGSDELCIQSWERDGEGVSSRVVSVIPDTVGQYTGLTDKNGKMIFEGDIVEYPEGIAEITWEETEALFGIKQDNDVCDFNSYWGQNLEVIGNVHDNPELLKGEE